MRMMHSRRSIKKTECFFSPHTLVEKLLTRKGEYNMNKRVLQDIEAGPRHHQVAIENLAQSLNRAPERVSTLYQMVFRHYSRNARIKYFLSALVSKRVKDIVRDDKPTADVEGRRGRSREL